MYLFWWRNENRKVTCAADPLALGAWDSGTPIRPRKSVKPHHITNFPQTTPPLFNKRFCYNVMTEWVVFKKLNS